MRVYRGLREPYRPDKVASGDYLSGTDFTDCPLSALEYARGRRGVVLVVELQDGDSTRVSEETWPNDCARRFMIWGRFDRLIAAVLPAKDLRAQVRKRGVAARSREHRSEILREYIEGRLTPA